MQAISEVLSYTLLNAVTNVTEMLNNELF